MSQHFKIPREAGLIRSERKGVELKNSTRCHELKKKYGSRHLRQPCESPWASGKNENDTKSACQSIEHNKPRNSLISLLRRGSVFNQRRSEGERSEAAEKQGLVLLG